MIEGEGVCKRVGYHHYFVADTVLVPGEGKVIVLALCTSCGNLLDRTVQVAQPNTQMTLKSLDESQKLK